MVFTILSSFLSDHIEGMVTSCDPVVHIVMVTTAVKLIGSDFVFGYIQAIDGEKVSPRLMLDMSMCTVQVDIFNALNFVVWEHEM